MQEKQLVAETTMVIVGRNEFVRIFDDGSAESEYFDPDAKMKVVTHYAATANDLAEHNITNILRQTLIRKLA